MFRDPLLRPWLLTLLCVSLVFARISGAHLHLCFDGNELPASFHLIDQAPHHQAPGAVVQHRDADVSAIGDALLKSDKTRFDWPPVLLGALLLCWLLQAPQTFMPVFRACNCRDTLFFLRPPLRGPPSLTSL